MHLSPPSMPGAAPVGRGPRRRLPAALLAAAFMWPGAAQPCSLQQLLELPFERLLQLTIQAAPAAQPARPR